MIFKARTIVFLLFAITVTLADDAAKPSVDAGSLNVLPDEPENKKTTKSPTTTVAPSPTTTPAPTTPPTAPTTTPAPTTAPTAPTTTLAPTTAPTAPTTTLAPTTAPTAPTTTPAPPKDWIISGNNSTVCIIANMVVNVTVPYNATGGKMVNAPFGVGKITEATASGECSPGEVQVLKLSQQNVNYTFTFVRNSTAKNYALGNMTVTILVNNVTFPNNTMPVKSISLMYVSPVFTLPLNNSYSCAQVDALSFNGTAGNTTVKATVNLSHVHVEAFGTGNSTNYQAPFDCTSGDTPDIVPIAVGLILAGLVVIVLIAYLVGRRRAQARGYLSM